MSFRRTWDKAAYAAKAQAREAGEEENVSNEIKQKKVTREEFQAASEGAEGPMGSQRAFLQARKDKITLDEKVGKIEVLDQAHAERGAGFFCEVCNCVLKDSSSYLAHVNGKLHQRALGFSMRVERANPDAVKNRIEQLSKAKASKAVEIKPSAIETHESRVAKAIAEEEALKEARKNSKKRKVEEKKEEDDDVEVEGGDPDMEALMGFSKLTSTKK